MNHVRQHQGFTLIELVIVIVILGILAATALPRFMDVTDQAHTASGEGAGGGLGAGVSLARAQWVANGADTTAIDNIVGFGDDTIDVNTTGWPTDAADGNDVVDDTDWVEVWQGVMQNPPTVRTTAAADNGEDYTAAGTDGSNECLYTYQPAAGRTITYDADDGSVVVVVP